MKYSAISLLLILVWVKSIGQNGGLALGEWRSHLPQQSGNYVTQTPESIVYSNLWNLIIINKQDGAVRFISKVDGLSDVGITLVKYDPINNQLIIIYDDANIDLLKEDGAVINIPNIKLNTSINTNKTINALTIDKEGVVYLASAFGIVSFDGDRGIFMSTTITNLNITSIEVLDNYLYAGATDGLYGYDTSSDLNISDFNLWNIIDQTQGIPTLEEIISLSSDGEALYVGTSKMLYRGSQSTTFEPFFTQDNADFSLQFLNQSGGYIIAGYQGNTFNSQAVFFKEGEVMTGSGGCVNIIQGAEIEPSGRVWYADGFPEIRTAPDFTTSCERITYNSPFFHTVSDIDIKQGNLYASDGGVSDNFQYLFSRNGFYIREESDWINYNEFNNSSIRDQDLLSFFRIKAHPVEDIVYVGTYWGGLLELNQETEEISVFTQENSSLRGAIGDEARERVTGILVQDDILWVSVYGALEPLNVRLADGAWTSFGIDAPSTITNITQDQFGYIWCSISGSQGGVLVYDPGLDIMSQADDRQIFLNSNNSELPRDRVNKVTMDLDGDMWVATDSGPVIFDCGTDIFEGDCTGRRRIVEVDSILAVLLADQNITAIEIDGANRKWFGTANGVFVQSEDGVTELNRFTEDNSPLFDNFIQDIAYDGISGEMYFATNRGIISYKTSTTAGATRNVKSRIYSYPNPVEPGYVGDVTIKGLSTDAEVTITDLNGNLIERTQALGGTATWDLMDPDGNRVSSGVYLVFTNQSKVLANPDGVVTKIMVIN